MGKTDLGKWMITNGGEYSADATYEQLTMVKYGNSTYITLKTVTGIIPTDDKINYQLMAQGFDATALSAVQAEDTQGLCGEKGEIVTAQSLVDALADKVMNTVMAKIGTAALAGGMTDLSSGVNSLYSNLLTHISNRVGCITNSSVVSQINSTLDIWEGNLHNIGLSLVISGAFAGGDTVIGKLPYTIKNSAMFVLNSWVASAHPIMGTIDARGNIMIARQSSGDVAEYRGNVTVFTDSIITE